MLCLTYLQDICQRKTTVEWQESICVGWSIRKLSKFLKNIEYCSIVIIIESIIDLNPEMIFLIYKKIFKNLRMMTNTMGGCSGLPRYTVKSIMAPSMTHLINQGIECEMKVCGHTVSSLKTRYGP